MSLQAPLRFAFALSPSSLLVEVMAARMLVLCLFAFWAIDNVQATSRWDLILARRKIGLLLRRISLLHRRLLCWQSSYSGGAGQSLQHVSFGILFHGSVSRNVCPVLQTSSEPAGQHEQNGWNWRKWRTNLYVQTPLF